MARIRRGTVGKNVGSARRARCAALGLSLLAACAAACGGGDDDAEGDGDGGSSAATMTGGGGSGGIAAAGGVDGAGTSGAGGTSASGGASGSGGRGGTGGTGGVRSCTSFAGIDASCGTRTLSAHMKPVNVLLVMDKSGSMDDEPPEWDGSNKWSPMKAAVKDTLALTESTIAWGLELFPAQGVGAACGDACCSMPTSGEMDVDIAPGAESVPLISDAIDASGPGGATPTAVALKRAFEYFTTGAFAPYFEGSRGDVYVLLATDGGPNCNAELTCGIEACTKNLDGRCVPADFNCCESEVLACLDDLDAVHWIEQLASVGVPTFVVGIPGSEAYSDVLNRMAVAGGRTDPSAPDGVEYYKVDPTRGSGELSTTFRRIIMDLVTTCEIPLETPPEDPTRVNVAIDCEVIDGAGWHFDDPSHPTLIILDDPYCAEIKANGVGRLDLLIGCATLG